MHVADPERLGSLARVTPHSFPATCRALPIMEDELRRHRPNRRQIGLILASFALRNDLTPTVLTIQRALHHDGFVDVIGHSSSRLLTILIPGFAPWRLGILARISLREGGSLAFAPAP